MAGLKRSKAELAICRLSEEIDLGNGTTGFLTRGSACLVRSKDLQKKLASKSKVFLVTSDAVIDQKFLEIQRKLNKKFKIIADFPKEGSTTGFESFVLDGTLFKEDSDIHVVDGITYIALTNVNDKWYSFPKSSIVSSRPLDFKFKSASFVTEIEKGSTCYVLFDAIGNHAKGFIARSYALKYEQTNFFLTRKEGEPQGEKYVHSIARFEKNEFAHGAVILNHDGEFLGVLRFHRGQIAPVSALEIFKKDAPVQDFQVVREGYSDPRESDDTLCNPLLPDSATPTFTFAEEGARETTATVPPSGDNNGENILGDDVIHDSHQSDDVIGATGYSHQADGQVSFMVSDRDPTVDGCAKATQPTAIKEDVLPTTTGSAPNGVQVEVTAKSSALVEPQQQIHVLGKSEVEEVCPCADSSEVNPQHVEPQIQDSQDLNSHSGTETETGQDLASQQQLADSDALDEGTGSLNCTELGTGNSEDLVEHTVATSKGHSSAGSAEHPSSTSFSTDDELDDAAQNEEPGSRNSECQGSSIEGDRRSIDTNNVRERGNVDLTGTGGARPKVHSVQAKREEEDQNPGQVYTPQHLPHAVTLPELSKALHTSTLQSTVDSAYGTLPNSRLNSTISAKDNLDSTCTRQQLHRTTSYPPESVSLPPQQVLIHHEKELQSMPLCVVSAQYTARYTIENLTESLECMETMSRQLDVVYKISRYVKYWKHLAEQLGISKEIYEKFCEVKQSPTEDLFYYVFASMPHLTLAGFCEVLSSKGRNDVLRILKLCMEDKKLSPCEPFENLLNETPDVLGKMAFKLDRGSVNYKDVAAGLGVPAKTVTKWGRNTTYNPTKEVFSLIASQSPWRTVKNLKNKLRNHNRPGVIQLLNKFSDDTQVAKVISDLVTMEALCEQLNEEIPGTKDWKHFAQSMDIDYESIDRALEPRGELKSPTQLMFEWLQCERPEFPADLVLTKLAEIKRYDVLQSIEKHFPDGYVDNVLFASGFHKINEPDPDDAEANNN